MGGPLASPALPTEVEAVFRNFRTCEFSTLAKDGTPLTWPTLPFWDAEQRRFIVTTSIGFPQKVFNLRRDGRVSLLFSEPRASGLERPPVVLVQGEATAPDEIITTMSGYEDGLRQTFERQPSGMIFSSNALIRYFADWYYMRLLIYVTPRQILWWPDGDMTAEPQRIAPASAGEASDARDAGESGEETRHAG
jgi:pyridoxamine 5'-phosphate oxidase-like protein